MGEAYILSISVDTAQELSMEHFIISECVLKSLELEQDIKSLLCQDGPVYYIKASELFDYEFNQVFSNSRVKKATFEREVLECIQSNKIPINTVTKSSGSLIVSTSPESQTSIPFFVLLASMDEMVDFSDCAQI